MKILVILAHPNKKSFNHAIAETAVNTLENNNHEVIFHDLYAEKFDPVIPAEELLAKFFQITDYSMTGKQSLYFLLDHLCPRYSGQ